MTQVGVFRVGETVAVGSRPFVFPFEIDSDGLKTSAQHVSVSPTSIQACQRTSLNLIWSRLVQIDRGGDVFHSGFRLVLVPDFRSLRRTLQNSPALQSCKQLLSLAFRQTLWFAKFITCRRRTNSEQANSFCFSSESLLLHS